jgi:hypothetical protein
MLLGGCSTKRGRAAALHDAAHSLLPEHAQILLEEEGDCVELAASPSCVQAYFLADRLSLDERVSAVKSAAGEASWELRRSERMLGGTELRFGRGRYQAIVTLATDERRRGGCDRERAKSCADVISVERG